MAVVSEANALALAKEIGCGVQLAHDLLALSGGDADIVRDASANSIGVESMKVFIIDKRIRKVEKNANH